MKDRHARYRERHRERLRERAREKYHAEPERHREYQRQFRRRRPEYARNWARERREWIRSLKKGRPCDGCGQTFAPAAMDWHHRDPATKAFGINGSAYSRSKEAILAEVEKCDLLCANCHREHHCV